MNTPERPRVFCERHHPGLVVSDIQKAVDFYVDKLGFTPGFTWGEPVPTFAGVNLGSVQIFLEQGTPHPEGGTFFVIGNADELFEFQRANGVEVEVEPGDREYGLRDYSVRDLHGHRLTFGHYIYNTGPAVLIERVDMPVRLEKRIVAVLQDLALFKRMSLSSLLEETFLHTFEPLGDGVASPHNAADIRYIQTLKTRHGIDYDCHASYRFVEREP
ncbi:MAG TPA: VOC family protein [Gemmatimonadales bacterium]|nr:VOC family protein [Gemmatimonadales bacterium]